MKIIRHAMFTTSKWKNGGGITHEIARRELEQKLLWRLSIAEVEQDGPFSVFPGLARILTVITGNGMDLIGQEDAQVLRVPLLVPVSFSGEKKLTGVLRDGPCKDFNLIFDPHRFAARVKILGEGDTIPTVPAEAELTGILCLGTAMRCSSQHLDPLDFACLEVGDQSFTISSGESALFMTLEAARST